MKNKEEEKRYQKQYRKTHRKEAREYARKWQSAHPEQRRKEQTLGYLRKALSMRTKLKNGWPDDGFGTELKCGYATIRPDQFRRFAQLEKFMAIKIKIRISKNPEACSIGLYKDLSIEEFLAEVCLEKWELALQLWKRLRSKF